MTAPLIIEAEVFGLPVEVQVQSPSVVVSPSPTVAVIVAAPGPRGLQGPPGEGSPIVGEILTGTQDGVNIVFTTAGPYRTGTLAVYRNGLRETAFTETTSTTFSFDDPPSVYDILAIDYVQQ